MANTSSRRVVSRPGVSSEGTGGAFHSPFQPPPAMADLEGDLLGTGAFQQVMVGGEFWRLRVPGPEALKILGLMPDAQGGEQIKLINSLLQMCLHPEDFQKALRRLLDPDSPFTTTDYMELYRRAATVGTARPFPQSSGSRAQRRSAGERSARSSRSRA